MEQICLSNKNMKTMDKCHQAYQFKISLKKITPMIWRRFLIQNESTLADLHYTIQILMGWTNYHLNEFVVHGRRYTIPNSVGMISGGGYTGNHIKLAELKLRLNRKFLYSYDFTAGWEFEIRFEKITPINRKKSYPLCLSGSGASPDEESGGPHQFNSLKSYWSYKSLEVAYEFLRALTKNSNAKKKISDICNIYELRQAHYWLNLDKYDHKKVNKYLKFYANNDERWQEAFNEVIYL